TGSYAGSQPSPSSPIRGQFSADNTASATTLIIRNANVIPSIAAGQVIDFTNNGTGDGNVIYSSNAAQTVYTNSNPRIGVNNSTYDNLTFSGTGMKNVQGGKLSIGDSFDNSANSPSDFTTNKTEVTSYTNTINIPVSARIFNGGTTGTTFTDFIITINTATGSANPNLNTTALGPTIITNRINIDTDGTVTLSGNSSLTAQTNATDIFTLKSGASSSATVMPIPSGSAITGNVSVERFVKGSPTDLSKRGYRLISSPVFTGTVSGNRMQSYNYLLGSVYVSGLAGGGFNAGTSTNPTLYLYREDITPTGTTFTSSNYKGIAKINNTNTYDIGTQRRFTTTNMNDTTVNVPVGNGTLFFFRGDKSNNTTQTGTKLVSPFDYPEDVVLTAVGNLTQGTVDFRHWFNRPNMATLSFTNSSAINNNTSPRNVRGYNLVGNPYASSIDWNKLNRNSTATNSSVYAPNIDGAVWFFNPTNKQYESYIRPSGNPANDTIQTTNNGTLYAGTGSASNVIASGQGFFVRANAAGGTLRFLESAKTIAQPAVASLNKVMGIPVSTVQGQFPYMRIQLKKDSLNDDDILIRFMEDGQEKYDAKEDAEDMG
ncbi:MAG: hypothetical protein INR69_22570, partial [Mucilaginibacter polytrichastri]|nr:hypothetical protein [Mucilaginibacter polytrichastri]